MEIKNTDFCNLIIDTTGKITEVTSGAESTAQNQATLDSMDFLLKASFLALLIFIIAVCAIVSIVYAVRTIYEIIKEMQNKNNSKKNNQNF